MDQKIEFSEAKSANKVSRIRNNHDSMLLHFMFIRDEITALPRPHRGVCNKKLDHAQLVPTDAKVGSTPSKKLQQELAEERALIDRLLQRLDEYDHAIKHIDRIALHALQTLGEVQVGGRKPNVKVKEMARAVVKKLLQEGKKLPTWKELDYKVRHELFKENPKLYIEKVKNGLDSREVLRNSIDPIWSYWRNAGGLVSERTWSEILKKIREETKKI